MKPLTTLATASAMLGISGLAHAQFAAAPGASANPLNPAVFQRACAAAAAAEPSAVRGSGKNTRMWCALVDREGKLLGITASDTGGTPNNPLNSDAWRGSIEIAIAKAYSAVAFSSNDQALDTRALGLASRTDNGAMGMPGTDAGPASLWGISASNPYRPPLGLLQGSDDLVGNYHHGIITFAGGQPIYTKGGSACGGGKLVGGFGVSGDGVDEDDAVAKNTVMGAGLCLAP